MKWYSPLLLTGLLLVPATPAAGQTLLSLMGGINVASLEVDSSDPLVPNLQSVSRMSIGLAATIPTSERVGIQLGGAYSQKGGSLEVQEDGATIASDIEFDYIELTVLARVGLPLSGDRVSAHLLVGPALAFQSSCQVAISARLGTVRITNTGSCSELELESKYYDAGLAGGGGIGIGLTDKVKVTLGLLYTYGLFNIDDTGGADTLKTRALTLRAGLDFPIG